MIKYKGKSIWDDKIITGNLVVDEGTKNSFICNINGYLGGKLLKDVFVEVYSESVKRCTDSEKTPLEKMQNYNAEEMANFICSLREMPCEYCAYKQYCDGDDVCHDGVEDYLLGREY
jgi:hypothetical protein